MSGGAAWLLEASAKAALLLAAAGLGAVFLRRASAAARHQIWALGVAGALLIPLLGRALPSVPLLGRALPSLPLVGRGLPSLPLEITASGASHSLVATAIQVTGERPSGAEPAWPSWLAAVWAVGALLVALRFLRGHLAARRLARTAEPARSDAWSSARHQAAAVLAISGVGLYRSEAIGSPMTIGVLRPRVLLPAEADGWSPERLRAVLVHELGHVRRRDPLVQLAAQLACALYWWNPLAWLAAARLRLEREHACDDLVLGAGIRPSSYATDLLEVARSLSPIGAARAGAVGMADRSWTEARLHRILDPAVPRRPLGARVRLAAWSAALAAAAMLACTSTAPARAPVASRAEIRAAAHAEVEAHASRGVLSLGKPSVRGTAATAVRCPAPNPEDTFDLSLVTAEVNRHLADLQRCYEQRLYFYPELAGEVVIHWVIMPTGEVADRCITSDTVGDPEVVACVNKLVEEGQFPAPRGGPVDVSFPFVFAPDAATAVPPGC
jgi:beta-lactamase regulating signal transducer with metallopeptidase domain